MRILLVTGLSGAGKSAALKTLEDNGCEAIDNVPLSLLPTLAALHNPPDHCLAIGADVRSRHFSVAHLGEVMQALRANGHQVELLFFDCDDEVLRRRFTETRRKHPLALDRPVQDGIRVERELLMPLRAIADQIFDTSAWNGGDLRHFVRRYFGGEARALSLFVLSFSFRQGVPREADMVFDVRFLKNPYYDEALRPLTGRDTEVAAFIARDPDAVAFFEHLTTLLLPLLPRFLREGKSYLTIALGCTGGRHRSVYMAEKLAGFLNDADYKVDIRHRDIVSSPPTALTQ